MNIYCHKCNRYCGEVRDAKLIKGLRYLCPQCEVKKEFESYTQDNPFADILGMINKVKRK